MTRITRKEAVTLLTKFAETGLFAEKDKIMDLAECLHAEDEGISIWGKDKTKTQDWFEFS